MVEDPVDIVERAEVASQCVKDLNLPMPALLDKMDDKVNQAYKGWPDRIFLVGIDGKLAYAGGRGPFYFSPDTLESSIKEVLGQGQNKK